MLNENFLYFLKNLNSSTYKVGQRLNLEIESLSFGSGAGVARHNGFVIFVTSTCPGDRVLVQLNTVKKKFATARVVEILNPSPQRQVPKCSYFGECGGCDWQHVSYPEQLRQKQLIVEKSLTRALSDNSALMPIQESKDSFNYRNRIQLQRLKDGFYYYKKGSHELVKILRCEIADERINKWLKSKNETFSAIEKGRVEIRLNKEGHVELSGEDKPSDGSAFSQVNRLVNEKLISTVLDKIPDNTQIIWDLYSGNGNFTIPIAEKFSNAKIVGVEINEKSLKQASASLKQLHFDHVQLILSEISKFFKSPPQKTPDFILLDPPRTGVDPTSLEALLALQVPRIVYISCNPMTLGRDLDQLVDRGGYIVEEIIPFDMFPQTAHVEVLASLRKI